jgi:leucyl aminopeptidase
VVRPELVDTVASTTTFSDAALRVGQTFTDSAAGLSIRVNAVAPTGATVMVDVPGGTCTPATCASLGATCGSPSNGCGAALSCGTCASGQMCGATFQCVTGSAGPQVAAFDGTLQAPRCGVVGTSCDSGASLLLGRGQLGPEPNAPNTINGSCADGTSGAFHSDESVDRLKVVSVDGTGFAAGKTVRIEATVWVWGTADDRLDLYTSPGATSPTWTRLTTLAPAATGQQTLTATFTLPAGTLQAVRANFRYLGSAAACSTGTYDDHDDLAFAVQ